MSVLDPKQDAAALQPLEQDAASRIAAAVEALPALLATQLDGMTIEISPITITIKRKDA